MLLQTLFTLLNMCLAIREENNLDPSVTLILAIIKHLFWS